MRINYNEILLLKEELYIHNNDRLLTADIARRINDFYFRSKAELILVLLKFYEYFLDKKDHILKINNTIFTFDYHSNIKRVMIKHSNKYTSIVSFLSLCAWESNRLLKAMPQNQIATSKDILSWEEEYDTIEGILNDYKADDNSYLDISVDSILLLNSQLRYHDTAYFRYEIDFENSIEVDENCNLVLDRIFYHPPYHIDMDYRNASNYKIAFDGDISNNILDIFQINHTHAFMVKSDYRPSAITQSVQSYFDNLVLSIAEKKERYRR